MSKKYIKQQNNNIKRNQRIEIIVTAAHTVVSLELFFFKEISLKFTIVLKIIPFYCVHIIIISP